MFNKLRNRIAKIVTVSAISAGTLLAGALPALAGSYTIGGAYMSMRAVSCGSFCSTVKHVSRTDYTAGYLKSANVVFCNSESSIPATGTVYNGSLPSGCSIVASAGGTTYKVFVEYTASGFTSNCKYAGISWVNVAGIDAHWVRNDTPSGWECV